MATTLARLFLALSLAVGIAAPASAQEVVMQATTATRTEQVRVAQEAQIQQGLAAGRIDAREASRLLGALARISRYQDRAFADGLLTLREQRRLERSQQRLQRHIDRALAL